VPIVSICPSCKTQLAVPDALVGKQLRCSQCQFVFIAEQAVEQPSGTDAGGEAARPATAITGAGPKMPGTPRAGAKGSPYSSSTAPSRRPREEPARKRSSGCLVFVVLAIVLVAGLFSVLCAGGIGLFYFRLRAVNVQQANAQKQQQGMAARGPDIKADEAGPKPVGPPPVEKREAPFEDKFPPFDGKFPPFGNKERPFVPPPFNPPPFNPPPFNPPPGPPPKEPAVEKTGVMPPLPAPLPIKPAPLDAEVVPRTFPDTIQNVVLGGGGRFLILHLPKLRQVAVFDVNAAKVVKYLPVAGDNVMIAAGMTKLILAFPDTKIIQRWSLLTFERELTGTLPINDAIAGIGMGYGSDGPLVVQVVREPISGFDHFLDIRTMKLIDVREQIAGHVHRGANAQMRGSADGRTFGISSGGQHPHALMIEAGAAKIRGSGDGQRVVPAADGKMFFGMGVYTPEMKRLGASPANNIFCVPALQGPFYLAIPAGTFHPNIPAQRKTNGIELRIVGDNRPLLTFPEIENAMRDVFSPNRDALTIDQRYHFIPDAQLLVTIPSTMDRLVLRKLNLADALDKSGIDYLFVASAPPPFAALGGDYSYPIQVKSKKGGLKYRVEAGPAGMKVSATGNVTWMVPGDLGDRQADVIITISDSSGQEIFHTFKLAVVRELPPEAKPAAGPPAPPVKNKQPKQPKKEPEPEPVVKAPPPGPDALTIRPPKLDETPITRNLPATCDQLVVGGGGRFLLLNLPSQRKIAMFDANEAKIVHYFPVGGDNVKYAAGLEKLVMVFPDTKIIQRWNLLTKEREVTATIDAGGITNVLMGSASRGPVVVASGSGPFGGGCTLLDLHTLKPRLAPQQGNPGGRSMSESARISADGTVIACWGPNVSPSGLQTYHITAGGLKGYYEHISPGHLVPSPDGKIIYTSRGMFTNETKPLGVNTKSRDGMGPWCIPAVEGDYYLSVNVNNLPGQKQQQHAVSVHLQGEERALITLPNIPVPKDINPWGREQFGNDKRLLFIPDAKMIVTVPETNDRLFIHRFDVEEAMDKAGIDYLYATSRAPERAARGKDYVYQITTRSKKGGVNYKLESGPDGMRITKAGVIHWKVPADQPAGDTSVIVTIADRSGQEIFHTFRVTVVDALPADGKGKE
jgi:hypothetical protein